MSDALVLGQLEQHQVSQLRHVEMLSVEFAMFLV